MVLIAMIMSGLALLVATVCLILVIRENKCKEKWKRTVFQCIDHDCKAAVDASKEYTDKKISERVDPVMKKVESIGEDLMDANGRFQDQLGQTLSNIMSFDPLESHRKARKQSMGMEADN